MKRIPALVTASALVLAACGGSVQVADDAPSVPDGSNATVQEPLAPGEPPVWAVSYEETEAIEFAWGGFGTPEDQVAVGMPDGCLRTEGGDQAATATVERCVLPLYIERGASEAALDLYLQRHWTVFDVRGSGPVWVAAYEDWDEGGNTLPGGQAIFTPEGIVDTGLAADVLAEALGSPGFAQIQEAVLEATAQDVGYALLSATIGTAEYTVFGPPVAVDGGWSVPAVMPLVGCHACTTAFAVKVAFDFASDGGFEDVRSLGFCWDPATSEGLTWAVPGALDGLQDELPTCDDGPLPVDMRWWSTVMVERWGW